jgi:hypothetical protein
VPVLIIAVPGFINGFVKLRKILPKGFWGIIWLGPKIVCIWKRNFLRKIFTSY